MSITVHPAVPLRAGCSPVVTNGTLPLRDPFLPLPLPGIYGIVYGTKGAIAASQGMRTTLRHLSTALFVVVAASVAAGQTTSGPEPMAPQASSSVPTLPSASSPASAVPDDPVHSTTSAVPQSVQPLLAFRDSEVKFSLPELMSLLRDHRHEGWVLAAYPDPKTGRPLIGAGFSLDLPEREHPQSDPLNPHPFVEPSSAELWQAAGLDPERLEQILDEYKHNLTVWRMQRYRRRIWSLEPEISDDDATQLLRVAAIQAVENARAYCRNFDQLTGPQQMALSQLVYQMGVNLERFGNFLSLINNDPVAVSPLDTPSSGDTDYWQAVQHSLMQSQWARLYRVRAVSVIAMLDPQYLEDPAASEHRVAAVLRPVVHRRGRRSAAALRAAAYRRHDAQTVARKTSGARGKQKV